MIGFDGGRATACAAALLLAATLPISAAPAREELVGGYVVSLAELWPFDGRVEARTFKCPTKGSCLSTVRIELRGNTYSYFVHAKATATTATISFLGRDRDAPKLTTGSGGEIEVSRHSDGAGIQDATLIVLSASNHWYTTKPYTLREPLPSRLTLAKVRITVRREEAEQPNR